MLTLALLEYVDCVTNAETQATHQFTGPLMEVVHRCTHRTQSY